MSLCRVLRGALIDALAALIDALVCMRWGLVRREALPWPNDHPWCPGAKFRKHGGADDFAQHALNDGCPHRGHPPQGVNLPPHPRARVARASEGEGEGEGEGTGKGKGEGHARALDTKLRPFVSRALTWCPRLRSKRGAESRLARPACTSRCRACLRSARRAAMRPRSSIGTSSLLLARIVGVALCKAPGAADVLTASRVRCGRAEGGDAARGAAIVPRHGG